jgi:hypothetical protein
MKMAIYSLVAVAILLTAFTVTVKHTHAKSMGDECPGCGADG